MEKVTQTIQPREIGFHLFLLFYGFIILVQVSWLGLVISDLWNWFVSPILSVREMTWGTGTGIALLATIIRGPRPWIRDRRIDVTQILKEDFLYPVSLAIFGLVAGFMVLHMA